MKYTVKKLADISGVSARTLRYYDQIGLLKPEYVDVNGYRIYGEKQVDLLQQILFYRELDISLDEIASIVNSPDFDRRKSLENHLNSLKQQKKQIELLIENVSKTLCSLKGEVVMNDKEKFEGLKKQLVVDNEREYGKEVREKYGDEEIDTANAKMLGMSYEKWRETEDLRKNIDEKLKAAIRTKNPSGEAAAELCRLHKEWICAFWKEGAYSKAAHLSLGQMYVDDERFKSYYDRITQGGAEFLYEALKIYCR